MPRPSAPAPAPAPPRLVFLLNTAQRRLQQHLGVLTAEHAAHTTGAAAPQPSLAQHGLLFCLAEQEGQTMGQLAQTLELAPSALTGLVQRLEAQGWVERRACTQDARASRVWLLPPGRATLPAARQGLAALNQRLTAGFSAEELQTVARWLNQVRQLPTLDGDAR
jgi:DNA-binding MarR family transcriptional regulator